MQASSIHPEREHHKWRSLPAAAQHRRAGLRMLALGGSDRKKGIKLVLHKQPSFRAVFQNKHMK
jgi:hypothetical protein